DDIRHVRIRASRPPRVPHRDLAARKRRLDERIQHALVSPSGPGTVGQGDARHLGRYAAGPEGVTCRLSGALALDVARARVSGCRRPDLVFTKGRPGPAGV